MEAAYRELQGFVRRAKTTPDRTGTLRRSALRQLIEAATQSHPSSSSSTNSNSSVQTKIFAAVNIPEFFQDFPEVEEDAINAVYDLCEDQSRQVRMEGYRTLASISKIEKKWVKRNADVLVQLLQSDEANEVNVVRKALIEHLHMDARVTLGVLCDQIVPPQFTTSTSARPGITTSRLGDSETEQDPAAEEEDYTEEDLSIRDNLRTLVLAFIVGELRKGTGGLGRYMPPGSEAESVLIDGLIGAIPRLGDADVHIILNDILLQLPGPFLAVVPPPSPSSSTFYPSPSSKSRTSSSSPDQGNKTRTRRSNLAGIILSKARSALSDDLTKNGTGTGPTRLTKSRPYFDALSVLFLTRDSNPSNGQNRGQEEFPNPTELLTFYSRLLPKSVLSSIEEMDQGIVVWRFSEALRACFQHDGEKDTKGDQESLRRLLNNLLPWVFEWFSNTDSLLPKEHEQTHLREACVILLERAFLMRTIDGVTLSSLIVKSVKTLGDKITSFENGAGNREGKMKKIQELIKSLTDKPTHVDAAKSPISPSTASSTSKPLISIPLSRTSSLPTSLSTSASTSSPNPNSYSDPSSPNLTFTAAAGPSNANANPGARVQSIPGSPLGQGLRRKQPSDSQFHSQDSHQAKKVKKGGGSGGGTDSERPSLLSRLGNTGSFESYSSPYQNQTQNQSQSQRRSTGEHPISRTINTTSNGSDTRGGGSLGLSIKGAANAAAANSTRTKSLKREYDKAMDMDADMDVYSDFSLSSNRAHRYPAAASVEHGSQTLIHRLGNGNGNSESGPSLGSRLGRGRGRGRGRGLGVDGAVGEGVHDARMLGKDSGSGNGGNGRNSKKRNGYFGGMA